MTATAPSPDHSRPGSASDQELAALVELTLLPDVGDVGVARLLERFGSARAALRAPSAGVAALVGDEAAARRGDPDLQSRSRSALARCRELGLEVVSRGSPGYPSCLEELHDPPAVLFLRGRGELLGTRRAVAVVGARRATVYGRRVAHDLAAGLARRGVAVVSGMALGVDGQAHEGALDAEGDTVAVLGSGADRPHPRSHAGLYGRIVRHGLVVSEFLPGVPARAHHFPRRNRVIAALAAGVVVVEAGARSGAFITVDHALDLGREVFAVPGSVESRNSHGTHSLIRQGATLVVAAHQIMEHLGWLEDHGRRGHPESRTPGNRYGGDAHDAWRALADGPAHVDRVARVSGLEARRALAALSLLEIEGWVVQHPGGRFARRSRG